MTDVSIWLSARTASFGQYKKIYNNSVRKFGIMASVYVKEKKKLRGIRGMLLAVTAVNVVLTTLLGLVSSFKELEIPQYIQALSIGLGAYVIPIMIYAFRNGITAKAAEEKFCFRGCGIGGTAAALVFGIGCQFAQIAINLPLSFLIDSSSVFIPSSISQLCAAIAVTALLPAVFEEFLFRGIVYCSMAELNTTAAAVFSSVMFAIMHADLSSAPGYLLMGFSLAYLMRRSASLYSAMVFHFANNATALILAFYNDALWYSPETMIALFACGIIAFAAGIISVAKIHKNGGIEKNKKVGTATLLGQSFISVPIILCIALTVAAGILIKII